MTKLYIIFDFIKVLLKIKVKFLDKWRTVKSSSTYNYHSSIIRHHRHRKTPHEHSVLITIPNDRQTYQKHTKSIIKGKKMLTAMRTTGGEGTRERKIWMSNENQSMIYFPTISFDLHISLHIFKSKITGRHAIRRWSVTWK